MSQTPSSFTPTPYTPSGDAHYTPAQGTYKELKPFRYWCQKVLPLVYDDSLSYYELLCKVVDYLNKTMEDVDTLHDDVDNLHTAYTQLENDMNGKYHSMTQWMNSSYTALVNFVNTYFANLDVQTEINNKLDDMAEDGSLSALIEPYVQPKVNNKINAMVASGEFADIVEPFVEPAVDDEIDDMVDDGRFKAITDPKVVQATDAWLGQHITNPSNPPLDSSFSLENAAAQSKAVGDKCFRGGWKNYNDPSTTPFSDMNDIPACEMFFIFGDMAKPANLAHLPTNYNEQGFFTIYEQGYKSSSGNAGVQYMYTADGQVYTRTKIGNSWANWVRRLNNIDNELLFGSGMGVYGDHTTSPFDDMDDITPNKMYCFHTEMTSSTYMAHLPDGYNGQLFFTVYEMCYRSNNGDTGVQFLYAADGEIYHRVRLSNVWQSWVKELRIGDLTNVFQSGLAVYDNHSTCPFDDMDTITPNKLYAFHTEMATSTYMAHLPTNYNGQLFFTIYNLCSVSGSAKSGVQFMYTADGETYYRVSVGGTFRAWVKLLKDAEGDLFFGTGMGSYGDHTTSPFNDMNDLTPNRMYCFHTEMTNPTYMANLPSGFSGELFFTIYEMGYKNTQNVTTGVQIMYTRSGKEYRRLNVGGTWESWHKELEVSDLTQMFQSALAIYDNPSTCPYDDMNDLPANKMFCFHTDMASPTNMAHLPDNYNGQLFFTIYEMAYQNPSGTTGVQIMYTADNQMYTRVQVDYSWKAWERKLNVRDYNLSFVSGMKVYDNYATSDFNDMDNITPNKMFAFHSTAASPTYMSHLPDNYNGSLFFTIYMMCYRNSSNQDTGTQFMFTQDGNIYFRHKIATWRAWTKVTTAAELNNMFGELYLKYPVKSVCRKLGLTSGKTFHVFGDSIATEIGGTMTWGSILATATGATEVNHAVGGACYYNTGTTLHSVMEQITGVSDWTNCDVVLIAAGTNDFGVSHPTAAQFITAVQACIDAIKTAKPTAEIVLITPLHRNDETLSNNLDKYGACLCNLALSNECSVISGYDIPFDCNTNDWVGDQTSDGLHPNDEGKYVYARTIETFN